MLKAEDEIGRLNLISTLTTYLRYLGIPVVNGIEATNVLLQRVADENA
jgi:hypothetical protein